MNPSKKVLFRTGLLLLLIPWTFYGQRTGTEDSRDGELIKAAREIMEAAGTCVLITLNENSMPAVRAMDPFPPEEDFTIWFGTNSKSRKVRQIRENPTVTLYYQDADDSGYVVIHGKARVVDDPKKKETYWKPAWEAFYPNKEGYLLIRVTPQSMEILSTTRGITGDPETWRVPVVTFD